MGCAQPPFGIDTSTGLVEERNGSQLCAALAASGVTELTGTPRSSKKDFIRYRYLAAPDGAGYPGNFYWKAFSNSVLVVPQSSLLSWLKPGSRLFRPYEHFLPVREDFSDLLNVWRWAEEHSDQCRGMALATQRAAQEAFTFGGVLRYVMELLIQYRKLLDSGRGDTLCTARGRVIRTGPREHTVAERLLPA